MLIASLEFGLTPPTAQTREGKTWNAALLLVAVGSCGHHLPSGSHDTLYSQECSIPMFSEGSGKMGGKGGVGPQVEFPCLDFILEEAKCITVFRSYFW